MIKGVGTDIIDISRVKKTIERDRRFVDKVFTEEEIAYCQGKFHQEIHYAARFAAKEALFKALGTGWRGGMAWQDISVGNDELGKPGITLSGKTQEYFLDKGCSHIHLSLSHTRLYAVAFVVIE